jgi:hypothetical protein
MLAAAQSWSSFDDNISISKWSSLWYTWKDVLQQRCASD